MLMWLRRADLWIWARLFFRLGSIFTNTIVYPHHAINLQGDLDGKPRTPLYFLAPIDEGRREHIEMLRRITPSFGDICETCLKNCCTESRGRHKAVDLTLARARSVHAASLADGGSAQESGLKGSCPSFKATGCDCDFHSRSMQCAAHLCWKRTSALSKTELADALTAIQGLMKAQMKAAFSPYQAR